MAYKITVLFVVAMVIAGIGNVLHIVGLATPVWTVLDVQIQSLGRFKYSKGLWEICADGECSPIGNDKAANLKACEAFAIIGMLFGLMTIVFGLLPIVLSKLNITTTPHYPLLSVFASVGSFAIIICVAVWGAKQYEADNPYNKLGYSLILSIVGGFVITIGGVLGYLTLKRVPS